MESLGATTFGYILHLLLISSFFCFAMHGDLNLSESMACTID